MWVKPCVVRQILSNSTDFVVFIGEGTRNHWHFWSAHKVTRDGCLYAYSTVHRHGYELTAFLLPLWYLESVDRPKTTSLG
jgi:hypothetical protein